MKKTIYCKIKIFFLTGLLVLGSLGTSVGMERFHPKVDLKELFVAIEQAKEKLSSPKENYEEIDFSYEGIMRDFVVPVRKSGARELSKISKLPFKQLLPLLERLGEVRAIFINREKEERKNRGFMTEVSNSISGGRSDRSGHLSEVALNRKSLSMIIRAIRSIVKKKQKIKKKRFEEHEKMLEKMNGGDDEDDDFNDDVVRISQEIVKQFPRNPSEKVSRILKETLSKCRSNVMCPEGEFNFTSSQVLTEDEIFEMSKTFIKNGFGEPCSESKKMGGFWLQSSVGDGDVVCRFDPASLAGCHGDVGPHMHIEVFNPDEEGNLLANNHVPIFYR